MSLPVEQNCLDGRVSAAQVRRFEPDSGWFVRGPGGIHGLSHETRVLIWTQVLARMVVKEGLTVDPNIVGWTAAIHDTQRWDDGIDPEHGDRAVDWIWSRPELLPPSVPIDRVTYLCRWHVPSDKSAPYMTDELRAFKDADALDRWRIYDLNPSCLRTKSARQLLDVSEALWSKTADLHDCESMFSQIVAVARDLDILVP